jgi:hypothetical protein
MPDDIMSTRLRLPKGLHKRLVQMAKKNGRSLNSEILWRLALSLAAEGDEEAPKLVERMAVEQRRVLEEVLRALIPEPKAAEGTSRFKRRF